MALDSRRVLVLVLFVALVVLNVIVIVCFRGGETEFPTRDPARDLSRGTPIARQRIDSFIDRTEAMSFAEAAESLNEYTEGFELAMHAGLSHGSPHPSVKLLQVLADRRVAKLYEILSGQNEEQAAEIASGLFAAKLDIHVDQMKEVRAGQHEDPLTVMTGVHLHAASASLFLCARFCNRETLLEHLDEWHAAFPDDSRALPGIFMSGLPESLFELNLLLLMLIREGATEAELNEWMAELRIELGLDSGTGWELVTLRFFKWNAHTNETDFTHMHRYVPYDEESILTEISGFKDWPVSFLSSGHQEEVVARARARF